MNLVSENMPNKQIIQLANEICRPHFHWMWFSYYGLYFVQINVRTELWAPDLQREVSLLLYFTTVCAPITTFTQNYHYSFHISFVHYNITIIKLPSVCAIHLYHWPRPSSTPWKRRSCVKNICRYIRQEYVAPLSMN